MHSGINFRTIGKGVWLTLTFETGDQANWKRGGSLLHLVQMGGNTSSGKRKGSNLGRDWLRRIGTWEPTIGGNAMHFKDQGRRFGSGIGVLGPQGKTQAKLTIKFSFRYSTPMTLEVFNHLANIFFILYAN